MIEKFPICFDRVSLHSISKLLRKLEKATTWQKSSTSNVSKYLHAWMMIVFFVFYSALFCIWYLIFGIWYLSENLKQLYSSFFCTGCGQAPTMMAFVSNTDLLFTMGSNTQSTSKRKKIHYQTTFVWTIIIGLNSMFPLFPALSLNYVSFIVLSKPDSFIIDLRRWLKSKHPD